MTRFQKWLLIPSGILTAGVVCLVATAQRSPLPDDLQFLAKLDGQMESKIEVYRTFPGRGRIQDVGFEQIKYVYTKPAGYIHDRIVNELAAKGWKREYPNGVKNLILSKSLPNNDGQFWLECITIGTKQPTVLFIDQSQALPQWRVWLHNLFN